MSRSCKHHGFRRLLERERMTVDDAAAIIGISSTHLTNFLHGRVTPGTRARIEPKLAEIFYAGNITKLRRVLSRPSPRRARR